jgi:hypothetical protein
MGGGTYEKGWFKVGARIDLDLVFEKSGEKTISVDIKAE